MMNPTHGQYFNTDKLHGVSDWQRIKQIALDNGFQVEDRADDVWRYSRKIAFVVSTFPTWKRKRLVFVRGNEWFAPVRLREEIELPRAEPAVCANVDMEAMLGLMLKMQAENDAIRGALFDHVNSQDDHIDSLHRLLKGP